MYLLLEHIGVYWLTCVFVMKYWKTDEFVWNWQHVGQVLFNQLLTTPTFLFIFDQFKDDKHISLLFNLWYFILCTGIQSLLFFFIHRFFHQHRWCWTNIHRIHHFYDYPPPWAAFYCHPIEHIFLNLLPVFTGPCIFQLSESFTRFWTIVATINAVKAHSGTYLRPKQPEFHDIHHRFYNTNYGVDDFCDKWFGSFKKNV